MSTKTSKVLTIPLHTLRKRSIKEIAVLYGMKADAEFRNIFNKVVLMVKSRITLLAQIHPIFKK